MQMHTKLECLKLHFPPSYWLAAILDMHLLPLCVDATTDISTLSVLKLAMRLVHDLYFKGAQLAHHLELTVVLTKEQVRMCEQTNLTSRGADSSGMGGAGAGQRGGSCERNRSAVPEPLRSRHIVS